MPLALSSLAERVRSSLFVLPMAAVLVAIGVGYALLSVDAAIEDVTDRVPLVLGSTVDSGRAVLSTVAAATISFAGIAFSVSLLVIQRGATQHSPRIVRTLFRDPFNKRVMALVLGTFTYCLVVLRAVRGPLEDDGQAVVPNLSLALAVVLGVAAILATVAFISHSAHTMDISVVLERVTDEALDQARRTWPSRDRSDPEGLVERPSLAELARTEAEDGAHGATVRFDTHGWVQAFDLGRLEELVPPGGSIVVWTSPGLYAVQGAPLCVVSTRDGGPADLDDDLTAAIRRTVAIGRSRTTQQDAGYGIRQLSDVGLRALSSGIDDPTTAQDAIFHLAAVLTELLRRDPPPSVRIAPGGGRLVLAREPTHADLVDLALDELRRSAAPHPAVCVYLIEALHLVRSALEAEGLGDRAEPLARQARLVLLGAQRAGGLHHDRAQVRRSWERRFGDRAPDASQVGRRTHHFGPAVGGTVREEA